ncbi:enoyl-[acyl-carrier-protein] reductase, mitochondrial-like [Selaginella moellendorffii]|uniref:enoyl-[acyl-carrier-protein] reductase, mitochondrial-like n=1 Tax=Selaginella moellendorffii TaxID=88036 RepID=UPI000D1CB260|nr:enoyl-[acyl-carrier-protein] reductase, mitochondrial-like [Selaginella moellendorffii]|eukprot:XP_024524246.1 enoyl-[acyl-carrier-protein] reductase, mitochondrial-like [Selaginella moellendorffii]
MAEHRAIHVAAFSDGDPAVACKVVMAPTPVPGRGQVLLKVLCRPVNPSDVLCIQGRYSGVQFPFVPGLEGMGEIRELGDGVTGFSRGQRVFHIFPGAGSWQEYALVPAADVIPIPDVIANEIAAQFYVNPWSAFGMLEVLGAPEGEYVLQTAAGSVLGRMFIQLAHHRGVKTINLVRRDEQKEELKAIGADQVINLKDEGIVKQVSEITGGKMAYATIDAVGEEQCSLTVRSMAKWTLTPMCATLPIDKSSYMGSICQRWVDTFDAPGVRKIADTIFELMAKGVMVPLVGEKFPLERAKEAIRKSLVGVLIRNLIAFNRGFSAMQSTARGGKVLLVS